MEHHWIVIIVFWLETDNKLCIHSCERIISWKPKGHNSTFKDVPLRTAQAVLSLYKVYGDSTLLVLNGTSLYSNGALLALNWRYTCELSGNMGARIVALPSPLILWSRSLIVSHRINWIYPSNAFPSFNTMNRMNIIFLPMGIGVILFTPRCKDLWSDPLFQFTLWSLSYFTSHLFNKRGTMTNHSVFFGIGLTVTGIYMVRLWHFPFQL